MRASLVVLALAISPLAATTAKAQSPAPSGSTIPQCQKDPGNPSPTGEENRTKKCPPPPSANGKVTLTGTLFFDLAPQDGLYDPANEIGIAGWNVVLTSPTGSVKFMTDASGFFSFAGLPSGATYTLCVEPSAGWTQTAPTSGASCLNSFGYTIVVPALAVDATISDQNFGFYSNTP